MRLINRGPIQGQMAIVNGRRVVVCELNAGWIPDLSQRALREALIATAPLGAGALPDLEASSAEWVKWWQGTQPPAPVAAPAHTPAPEAPRQVEPTHVVIDVAEAPTAEEVQGPAEEGEGAAVVSGAAEPDAGFVDDVLTLLEGRQVSKGARVLVTVGKVRAVICQGPNGLIPYAGNQKPTSGIKLTKTAWLDLCKPGVDAGEVIPALITSGGIKLSGTWASDLAPLLGDEGDADEEGEE